MSLLYSLSKAINHISRSDEWISRRGSKIRDPHDTLLVDYNGLPCVRIEVQLLYKARGARPKDQTDFAACLSQLDPLAKQWFIDELTVLCSDGHPWLPALA
jgi:hypothetical protein